jgi:aerobic-type carbon monoxide dehydrogenase small subunit (CoxS/CutS family)
MNQLIKFTLNGKATQLETEPERPLLCGDLALTGTKYGCGEGLCGACTVLVNGQAAKACLYSIKDIAGKDLTTIEGLAAGKELHPVQRAFVEHDALQCGYCTPGMIMAVVDLLTRNPAASDADIVAGLDNNLCRCGVSGGSHGPI